MLLADIGLVQSAMTALNVEPDLIDEIVMILKANSDGLESHHVDNVGPAWFGGSSNAHELGEHALKAQQAIVEEFVRLAESLRQYSVAIIKWADEVQEVDDNTTGDNNARASALKEFNHAVDHALDEAADTTMGDGVFDPDATTTEVTP